TRLGGQSKIYRQLSQCGPGRVLYRAVDQAGQDHIARTDISTGLTSTLTDGPLDNDPACSADGSTLVFTHCTLDRLHCSLMRKALDSGQLADLYKSDSTTEEVRSAVFFPDGTVWVWRQVDGGNLYEWGATISLDGTELKK